MFMLLREWEKKKKMAASIDPKCISVEKSSEEPRAPKPYPRPPPSSLSVQSNSYADGLLWSFSQYP